MHFFYTLLFTIFSFSQVALGSEYFDLRADYLQKSQDDYLAITFKNKEHWHSYWKNPGDAGLPVKILFDKIQPQEMNWPAPETMDQGDVLSYGYNNIYTFFFKLDKVSKTSLENSPIKVTSEILICHDICIPTSRSIDIQLVDGKITHTVSKPSFTISQTDLLNSYDQLPTDQVLPNEFSIDFIKVSETLYLHYKTQANFLSDYQFHRNLLTPYPHPLLGFSKEKLYQDREQNIVHGFIEVSWDGEYSEPPVTLPELGELSPPLSLSFLAQIHGASIKVSPEIHHFKIMEETRFNELTNLSPFKSDNTSSQSENPLSLIQVILFALLGGFILNLMPCVLPVISIKLMGLIQSRGESNSRLFKHNMSYTLGVISTFMLLGAIVHFIKAQGSHIGWGFQLQSPTFVIFVTLVIFLMALNMFGIFEFKTPGGSKLGSANLREGFWGDFFSGVISTVLSTPCSAPFLGTALTFAFTTTSSNIYLIFLCIGIGLASPFILIGFFPRLISFMPKPGMWMQKLKYFLGFILLITALWLLSLVFELTQSLTSIALLTTIMITSWLSFKRKFLWIMTFALLGFFFIQNHHHAPKYIVAKPLNSNWSPWSLALMDNSEKETRFINFTAAWCLTCKVNKKLVLDTDKFYQFAKEHQIKLVEGDWTHRDDTITKWLAKYQVVGVPAYFIQKPSGEIIHLGETTSIEEIKENL